LLHRLHVLEVLDHDFQGRGNEIYIRRDDHLLVSQNLSNQLVEVLEEVGCLDVLCDLCWPMPVYVMSQLRGEEYRGEVVVVPHEVVEVVDDKKRGCLNSSRPLYVSAASSLLS